MALFNKLRKGGKAESGAGFEIKDGVLLKFSGGGDVALPREVVSIGEGAFSGNTAVRCVALPEGVTVIGKRAFDGCTALERVELPSTLERIELQAFRGCASLQSADIPQGVREVGFGAFDGCRSLARAVLPTGLGELSGMLFYDCESLLEIAIPEDITEIQRMAFKGCKSLTEIRLPQGLEIICDGAFEDCRGLREVVIPHGVRRVLASAFLNCRRLERVELPDSLESLGDCAFKGCTRLDGVVIPDSVSELRGWLFCGCTSLSSIVIPDSVYAIGVNAFWGCRSLKEVELPKSVWRIGVGAFRGCPCQKAVERRSAAENPPDEGSWVRSSTPDGVKIETYRGSAVELTVPQYLDGRPVTTIGSSAFSSRFHHFETVTLPESVCRIEVAAFWNSVALRRVNLPRRVTCIPSHCFGGCERLEEIIIPARVRCIDNSAFTHCHSLTTVTLPKGLAALGCDAFSRCEGLREVLTEEGSEHFRSVDGVLFNGDMSELLLYPPNRAGEEYTVPDSVSEISSFAFEYCRNLRRLVLPEGLKTFSTVKPRSGHVLNELVVRGDTVIRTPYRDMQRLRLISLRHSAGEWDGGYSRTNSESVVLGYVFGVYNGFEFEEQVAQDNRDYISVYRERLLHLMGDEFFRRYVFDYEVIRPADLPMLIERYRGNIEMAAQLLEYQRRHFPEMDTSGFDGGMYSLD